MLCTFRRNQGALKNLRLLRLASPGLAVMALVLAVLFDAQAIALNPTGGLISVPLLGWLAISLGLMAVSYGTHRLIGLFYLYEFEHARND